MMSSQKIIFFDIDGTLYNDEKVVPDSTKEAVKAAKDAGHIAAIATGRSPFMYEDLRAELGISTFVSMNGNYVVFEDELIYTNPLDAERLEDITAVAMENDHPIVYLDDRNMHSNVPEHDYMTEGIASLKLGFMPGHDPEYHIGRSIYQSLLFCPKGEEGIYQEHFTDAFQFIRWHTYSMDVSPKNGSKAEGIKKIVEKMDVDIKDVYAFGDGANDVEMLRYVPNSFAMGNAREEIKAQAKHVTSSVDADGIMNGLQMADLI